jgi:hypothetical protein
VFSLCLSVSGNLLTVYRTLFTEVPGSTTIEIRQIDEAKESILREIEATEGRGSRVVELQQIRDSYAEGGSMYFTHVEGGRPPYDADPEARHDEYRRLELRVKALAKDELEVSGVFGTQRIYTDDPLPRPRRTATTSS